jgi:lysophospholipase L1-like esterase
VDYFANCTSGGQIRFRSNTTQLAIRVKLGGLADLNHMPATSQCGFDCYIEIAGAHQFHSTTRYDHTQTEYEIVFFKQMDRQWRSVTLYFPLYQRVDEVLIGLDPEAEIGRSAEYRTNQRVLVYGTSITQGASASRPGMSYPNILSRRIPLEFINLGFSASGRGEPEVAEIISHIPNPACLILDYEANCPTPEHMARTLPEFISIFRKAHPNVPILVLSKIRYARERFNEEELGKRLRMLEIQMGYVESRHRHGDEQIHFLDGTDFLGEDFSECTVDGVHPNDMGFMRIANAIYPTVVRLLQEIRERGNGYEP